MDWFEAITGFREESYEQTQAELYEEGGYLHSRHSSRRFAIGRFSLPSLSELRAKQPGFSESGRLTVRNISGDVRAMHRDPQFGGALFQVASQFNMLEMISPGMSPEDGVTRYKDDPTQGPGCAIAAGAATIYRHYLVPVRGGCGQSAERQIDGLADLGKALSERLGCPVSALWDMRNGYALGTETGIRMIGELLENASENERDELKGLLRIGLHEGAQVTDRDPEHDIFVSQAFCSALPVAYSKVAASTWDPFARLILEAAYEATLLAGIQTKVGGSRPRILLTRLGGGAFGNRPEWIDDAILGALRKFADKDIEVFLVSHGAAPASMRAIEREFE